MDEQSRGLHSSYTPCQESLDQISLFLGHHINPATCSSKEGQMPLSSCYSTSGGGEDSGAGNGFRTVDQDSWLDGRMKPVDQDLDSLDCESEDGLEVTAAPAKPAPVRSSCSKRSRAGEVHNMSEKRRRSRINEKMKALQTLIPNSNKTDKASMLDEAIEYLKQLQLQVQMLSVRNGLNLHPMYLSGALQPLLGSHMYFSLGSESERESNIGMSMLPLNQDSAAQCSFDLSSQGASSLHSATTPSLMMNMRNSQAPIEPKLLQSHHGSFHLPLTSEEMFTGNLEMEKQSAYGRPTKNLAETEMRSMVVNASQQFGGQASSMVVSNRLEDCMLGRERSLSMLHKEPDDHIKIQQFHR